MATFTIELWRVLELEDDPGDGSSIGLDAYPIPKRLPEGIDAYGFRDALNRKIINHYWNREIGMETISLFTFALRRRMAEVMPLYVQVYESELLEFDPLSSVKLTTDRDDTAGEKTTRKSTNTADSDASSGSKNLNSDFPQAELDLDAAFQYATSGANAISASKTNTTGSGEDDAESESTAKGTSTTAGYQGAVSDLLTRFRATFLNVDMLVIGELSDCFLQVWDNGEEYLPAAHHYRALY